VRDKVKAEASLETVTVLSQVADIDTTNKPIT
jgi:hypothetical protein